MNKNNFSFSGTIGHFGVTGSVGPIGVTGSIGSTGFSGIGGPTGSIGYSGTSRPMYVCYHCNSLFAFDEVVEIDLEDKSQVLCKPCCREYKIEELIEEFQKIGDTFDL